MSTATLSCPAIDTITLCPAGLESSRSPLSGNPGPASCGSSSRTIPSRGERMTAEAVGIYLDYSKNRITDETIKLLLQLAEEVGLRARIDAMFRGEKINLTEKRAVLHVALRAPRGANHHRRRRKRGAPGSCRARPDGGLFQSDSERRLEGPHRQAHSQRDQHRHRRLRSRAGDGL